MTSQNFFSIVINKFILKKGITEGINFFINFCKYSTAQKFNTKMPGFFVAMLTLRNFC